MDTSERYQAMLDWLGDKDPKSNGAAKLRSVMAAMTPEEITQIQQRVDERSHDQMRELGERIEIEASSMLRERGRVVAWLRSLAPQDGREIELNRLDAAIERGEHWGE